MALESETKSDADMTTREKPSLSLHDCLSLGEVELGLEPKNGTANSNNKISRIEQIERLPLFLRVLSLTRPSASISILEKEEEELFGDPVVNCAVGRLEHVAATYSVAEGVDVVTCHLAPSVSRKLSKLPPLERHNGEWDTRSLVAVARNPRSSSKRRRSQLSESSEQATGDEIQGSTSEEEDDEDDEFNAEHQSLPNNSANKKRKKDFFRRDSMEVAAEDSQEATVTKTLSELASLVATSLEPVTEHNDNDEEQKGKGIALAIDDSILSESAGSAAGGAMEGSDLGSTVVAILHHAPVLRSEHVANALCRAAIPQAGNLLTRMGANCPASVPSLLLGCTKAYSSAISHGNTSIANVAKQCATALAELSPSECNRIRNKLQSLGVMVDVQLKLAIQADVTSTACILIHHLSDNQPCMSLQNDKETSDNDEQKAGDTSSDFRAREMQYNIISQGKEPTLWQILSGEGPLYRRTLDFFAIQFSDLEKMHLGKLCLLLRAYGWLMLVPVKMTRKFDLAQQILDGLISKLTSFMENLNRMATEESEAPERRSLDKVIKLSYCCVLVSLARILVCGGESESELQTYKDIFKCLLKEPSVSKSADGFVYVLKCLSSKRNIFGVFVQILEALSGRSVQSLTQPRTFFPFIEKGLKRLCEFNQGTDINSTAKLNVLSRLSIILLEIQDGSIENEESTASRSKELLFEILTNDGISLSSLLQDEVLARFVAEATTYLSKRGKMGIPIVLPFQLEVMGSKLTIGPRAGQTPNDLESRFLLQLLHAFEFLDQDPKSPFAFDPRSSPVKEALCMVKTLSNGPIRHFLETKLQGHAAKRCPEALWRRKQVKVGERGSTWTYLAEMPRKDVMNALHASICSRVEDLKPSVTAYEIEEIFLHAKSRLSDADLYSTSVSALLASPHKPPTSYTYNLLCRDPLVLFKCSIKVWKCKGLRRIILNILLSLLESNTAIVWSESPSDDSAAELLAARNAMVVRCLIISVSGLENDFYGSTCCMTTSIIRSMISDYHGIVSILVRQGLPETALDWLIEFVPETMNDSKELLQMFDEPCSLTPAERLVAADALIRIAIVHGHANEVEASTMAYTALAQLVDSFFLVVGPVGVPVNALIADESGLDVTQISRKAAFRILRSLLRVRGRRTRLRKECVMALQKLANLCKGESAVAGVAGSVAGRRKSLLKEIFDAAVKAANAMGGSIGAPSSAA